MYIDKIPVGMNVPKDVNVIIEMPLGHHGMKYEIDKDFGIVRADRLLKSAMHYPVNYGFVPNTLGGDKDPLDVLVISDYKLVIGSLINVKPVAVFLEEDGSGIDEKILAVPSFAVDSRYKDVNDVEDVKDSLKSCIKHFFEHYKDLDKDKWVKSYGFKGREEAEKLIIQAVERYKTAK